MAVHRHMRCSSRTVAHGAFCSDILAGVLNLSPRGKMRAAQDSRNNLSQPRAMNAGAGRNAGIVMKKKAVSGCFSSYKTFLKS